VHAGGGGGGGDSGGGAGGLVYNESYPVTPGTTYTVVVGAGGIGAYYDTTQDQMLLPKPGASSSFDRALAIGGGAGGEHDQPNPYADGGSGGGGYLSFHRGVDPGVDPGKGTPCQGHDGGRIDSIYGCGGGGGGAGGAGGDASTSGTGGSGGAGLYYSITGASACYAGGGGGSCVSGGQGGCPGGGQGRDNLHYASPVPPNTGCGGGADDLGVTSDTSTVASNGGSGIVVLRF
jgi:hypothetical protein